MMLALISNRPALQIFAQATCFVDDDKQADGERRDPFSEENPAYPLYFELKHDGAGFEFRSTWMVSKHFLQRKGLLSLDISAVNFEYARDMLLLKALAVERSAPLFQPGATVAANRLRSGGLDVRIAANSARASGCS